MSTIPKNANRYATYQNNKSLEQIEIEILYWKSELERLDKIGVSTLICDSVYGTTFELSREEIVRMIEGFEKDYEIFTTRGHIAYTGRKR